MTENRSFVSAVLTVASKKDLSPCLNRIKTGRYSYYSVPDAVVRYSTDISLAPAGQSGRSVQ